MENLFKEHGEEESNIEVTDSDDRSIHYQENTQDSQKMNKKRGNSLQKILITTKLNCIRNSR